MTETQEMLSPPSLHYDMNTKLEAKNVNAFFGKTQALQNVSLAIQKNHVVAIIGPSGCGKSTFLRCLNGGGRCHRHLLPAVAGGPLDPGRHPTAGGGP